MSFPAEELFVFSTQEQIDRPLLFYPTPCLVHSCPGKPFLFNSTFGFEKLEKLHRFINQRHLGRPSASGGHIALDKEPADCFAGHTYTYGLRELLKIIVSEFRF